jgi:hypothetical protein
VKVHPGALMLVAVGCLIVAAFLYSVIAGLVTSAVALVWTARRLTQ